VIITIINHQNHQYHQSSKSSIIINTDTDTNPSSTRCGLHLSLRSDTEYCILFFV